MTEIEAQKFITRFTPRLHRCEITEAKIRRIESEATNYFFKGAGAILISIINFVGWSSFRSGFGLIIFIVLFILGILAIGFGFWMKNRLREVRHLVYPSQSQTVKSQIING